MNPNATLDTINDPSLTPDERLEAIQALLEWIDLGGVFPSNDRPDCGMMVEETWAEEFDYDGRQLVAYDLAAKLANGIA